MAKVNAERLPSEPAAAAAARQFPRDRLARRPRFAAALLVGALAACDGRWPALSATVPAPSPAPVRVHDIQGSTHVSPLLGQPVRDVFGVVTSVDARGFWMQDDAAHADARDATSEGLLVYGATRALAENGDEVALQSGDAVLVSGRVAEWRPGSRDNALSLTEIDEVSAVRLLARGRPLPAPALLGRGGRAPPARVIAGAAPGGDAEAGDELHPATAGLDFFESLEGMLVRVDEALVVAPGSTRSEAWVVGDGGALASSRNARGGLTLLPDDAHPERLLLDGRRARLPALDVGAVFDQPLTAIVQVTPDGYRLAVLPDADDAVGAPTAPSAPTAHGGVDREIAEPLPPGALSVATFNVENLSALSPQRRFDALAEQIVVNLRAPDLVALQEVQDDSGARDDGVVTCARTLERLVEAIAARGGPRYGSLALDPVDGQDGGQPGANIRVALLHDPATLLPDGSPRRLATDDPAFRNARKPLAAALRWQGRRLDVIVNHWKSKAGDEPLFGRHQPPRRATEVQRLAQAASVHEVVAAQLAADPDAAILVLGDFNDFGWSDALAALRGELLFDLSDSLPPEERYSYLFMGNSQQLDHILVSRSLRAAVAGFRFVHVNAEFSQQASDHDPGLARLLPPP